MQFSGKLLYAGLTLFALISLTTAAETNYETRTGRFLSATAGTARRAEDYQRAVDKVRSLIGDYTKAGASGNAYPDTSQICESGGVALARYGQLAGAIDTALKRTGEVRKARNLAPVSRFLDKRDFDHIEEELGKSLMYADESQEQLHTALESLGCGKKRITV